MPIPTRNELVIKRGATLYRVPQNLTVDDLINLSSVDPVALGWAVYGPAPSDGSTPAGLSTDCSVTTSGLPVWNEALVNASKPAIVPGQYFEWVVPYSWAAASTGHTIVSVVLASHPFLSAVNQGVNQLKIYGTVPMGQSANTAIVLTAVQDDGKNKPLSVTLTKASATIYANWQWSSGDKKLAIRVGPDAGVQNLPIVTLYTTDGVTTGSQQSIPFTTGLINGKQYYYLQVTDNPAIKTYYVKIQHLGQTLYGTIPLTGSEVGYNDLSLSTTAPTFGTPTPAVIANIDQRWVKNSSDPADAANREYLWFNVTQNANMVLQLSWAGNSNTWTTVPTSRITGDAKGYTHAFDLNFYFGAVLSFRCWAVGNESVVVPFSLTVPASSVPSTTRIQIYPTIVDNPPTTQSTQQIVRGNPSVFDPGIEWSGGNARILNLATPSIGSGQALYVFISGQPYRTSMPTTYDYKPGDTVSMMVAIATSPDPNTSDWSKKAYFQTQIGPAPTL